MIDLTAESVAKTNAAISALGSLFETDPGDGQSDDPDVVIAARVLRSGWIGDYFFWSTISKRKTRRIVQFWRRSSEHLPPFANQRQTFGGKP